MSHSKISLLEHYRKLWFFNFHRFEGDNLKDMREYFAHILLAEVEEFSPLHGKSVLDVGGASGEMCTVLYNLRECKAVNLEPRTKDIEWRNTVRGYANELPFDDNQFDFVICRGVMEHIPLEFQQTSLNEMYRVTKFGGLCYILIPPWYNAHAGHGLKPFHIFPFKVAKFLRKLFFGTRIRARSWADANLYPITFRRMLAMAKRAGFTVTATRDTHFRLHFMTRIPLLREVLVPSAAFLLTKRERDS